MSRPVTRTALITGASRGIGAAIAAELGKRGVRVFGPARAELDLGHPASVDRYLAVQKDLAVDILVNNAGINVLNPIGSIDAAAWSSMIQVNLTSALRLIQAFAPGMAERKWGRVLSVSSVFSIVTKEKRAAYSMTKAALNALTRSAAVEYGPSGILVNALAPGYVDTELTRRNNSAQDLEAICKTIPLRRMAQTAELAKAAAFLVSEENTYLTGQTVVVDGGFTCQ
ncbi:MAG: short-chain dehydrogenase [Verrucomicrobia bacterium]|nr:MAG: short-chain dehydrogenase [Verrucomicrobiota bacterium]